MKRCYPVGTLFIAVFTLFCHGAARADVFQDWNIEVDSSDCHKVSGKYQSIGVSNRGDSPYYTKPLLERNLFGVSELKTEDHSVLIEVNAAESQLNLSVLSIEHGVLASKVFNEPFSCEDGWIVYRTSVSGSGDGSSVKQTDTMTKFARSKSGELIAYHEMTSITRKWWFFSENHEFEIWYKFDAW